MNIHEKTPQCMYSNRKVLTLQIFFFLWSAVIFSDDIVLNIITMAQGQEGSGNISSLMTFTTEDADS